MNKNMIKVVNIEYIENIYALAINAFNKNNNMELKGLIDELNILEDKIRIEEDEVQLNNQIVKLNNVISRIEVLINE